MSEPSPHVPEIEVTDHAVVRWLERVCGADIAKVRQEILDAFVAGDLNQFAARGHDAQVFVDVPSHRVHLLARDGEVITVFNYEGEPD